MHRFQPTPRNNAGHGHAHLLEPCAPVPCAALPPAPTAARTFAPPRSQARALGRTKCWSSSAQADKSRATRCLQTTSRARHARAKRARTPRFPRAKVNEPPPHHHGDHQQINHHGHRHHVPHQALEVTLTDHIFIGAAILNIGSDMGSAA
eukprot:2130322-Prymnesium_polylepis.1